MTVESEPQWAPLEISERGPRGVWTSPSTVLGQWALVVAMVLTVFLGLFFGYREVSTLSKLQSDGRTVKGTVTNRQIIHSKSNTYRIFYEFEARGETLDDKEDVQWNEYDSYREGGPISVTYLPDKPATHVADAITDERIKGLAYIYLGCFGAAFALMFAVSLGVRASLKTETGVLQNFVAAPAWIDTIGPTKGQKVPTNDVTYRYRDQENRVRVRTDNLAHAIASHLHANSGMTVLIDPQNPDKIRLLESVTMAVCKREAIRSYV